MLLDTECTDTVVFVAPGAFLDDIVLASQQTKYDAAAAAELAAGRNEDEADAAAAEAARKPDQQLAIVNKTVNAYYTQATLKLGKGDLEDDELPTSGVLIGERPDGFVGSFDGILGMNAIRQGCTITINDRTVTISRVQRYSKAP